MTAVLRHVRQAAVRTRRGVDAAGRIRPLRGAALTSDPRGRTACGAEPTTDDVDNRTGRSKSGRSWVTCADCLAALDAETGLRSANAGVKLTP